VGSLALFEGDFVAASLYLEEASSIAQELGDKFLIANTDFMLGFVRLGLGNIAAARPLFEESQSLTKELGYVWGEAKSLFGLGTIAYVSGDLVAARTHDEESLRLFLQQGDVPYTSLLLNTLEIIGSSQGDEEMARSLHQQRSLLMQQASQRGTHGLFLISSGEIWLHMLKDELQAKKSYTEGLRFLHMATLSHSLYPVLVRYR
jgi:tetratricopeptide (TPR) repeat protein